MELQSQNETKPKHEDLSASLADIEKKQMLFEAEVNSILDTPAPVEEKKAEEPAADDEGCCSNGVCEKEAAANADAEMKDEEAATEMKDEEAAAAENSNAAEPEAAAADD